MPLSTSNSEYRGLKYVIGLLAALAIGQAMLQSSANWFLRHHGKNEMRWAEERKAAGELVHDGKGVLIIGSSVVLGIDEQMLQNELPDWTVRRLVMVGAAYTDWTYSLRRLFNEGVRPEYVVIPPVPFQIYSDAWRGDYLPLHWMDRQDIPVLAKEKHLDLTATSNLYFASYNAFFALRDDFRNALLGNIIPGHKVLAAGAPNKRMYKEGEVDQIVGDRLVALQSLVAGHGARLIILHYPAPNTAESWEMVKRVVAARKIPYIQAVDRMPDSNFEDALHLDPEGTAIFTKALGPALDDELKRLKN